PLKAEADKRADWRGGKDEGARAPQAGGGTLRASQDEDERMTGGAQGRGTGRLGTAPPPD
ncbi:MAG TPA: hypothetical protein VNT25_07485, partial [Allosphingosinicella sp.]|nr:hypothetical protein [Allosphingosinicella sp.]